MLELFLEKIKPKFEAMLEKRFLKELIVGNLERKKFLNYLVQDTLYLRDYVKCYAFLITKTDNIKIIRILVDCLNIIKENESAVHIKYLEDFGFTEQEALCEPMVGVNRNYLDYMLNICKNGTLAEGLASVLPCAYSYYYIFCFCRDKAKIYNTYDGNYYKKYIDFYSSAEYSKGLDELSSLSNLVFENTKNNFENLYGVFKKSTNFESNFWNIPFLQKK